MKEITKKTGNNKLKKCKVDQSELEDLREHIDLISHKIDKVYRRAKDRNRKEIAKAKTLFKKKKISISDNDKMI